MMDREYYAAGKRYGWRDDETMRKRWKFFMKHRQAIRQRNARLHHLYQTNRSQWESELSKLSVKEQERQRRLEIRKASLLSKLKR